MEIFLERFLPQMRRCGICKFHPESLPVVCGSRSRDVDVADGFIHGPTPQYAFPYAGTLQPHTCRSRRSMRIAIGARGAFPLVRPIRYLREVYLYIARSELT